MTVYDAGMLVALDRGDRHAAMIHEALLEDGDTPLVPAGVLAQAWRGGPQAELSRALRACHVVELDEKHARVAGSLAATAGTRDVVDASVVTAALPDGGPIVTSDAVDIAALLDAVPARIRLIPI